MRKDVASDHKQTFDDELGVFGRPRCDATGPNECELSKRTKTTDWSSLRIGVRKAVPVDFRAAPVHGKSSKGRRGVFSAIVAGVAYIMSKRLVEL